MTPKEKRPSGQQPLIGARLEFLIDLDHELARLAQVIPWEAVAKDFYPMYCPGNGRPAIPTRWMAGLHLLKHTYGLSDEQVVARWPENPYWQFLFGEEFFQHPLPIHPPHSSSHLDAEARRSRGGSWRKKFPPFFYGPCGCLGRRLSGGLDNPGNSQQPLPPPSAARRAISGPTTSATTGPSCRRRAGR